MRTPFADHSIRRVFSRIVANLPLVNSITGPPVNLAITPDQRLALVANSLDWVKDGEDWKGIPDNKIFVIDLTASPPVQIATVEAGKQPSGMAINKAGTLALVANRADDSVSVLSIDGKNVKPEGAVSVSTQPMAAVATHLRRCLLPSQSPPTASMHSSSRAARYPTQLL